MPNNDYKKGIKTESKYNVEITGTIYVLDDKKVYTILEIRSFY
jgi:hypothetical protein